MILTLEALSRFCATYAGRYPFFTKPWWCEKTKRTFATDKIVIISTKSAGFGAPTAETPAPILELGWGAAVGGFSTDVVSTYTVFSGMEPWHYEELGGVMFDHARLTQIRELGGIHMDLWQPPKNEKPLIHFRNDEVEGFLMAVDLDDKQTAEAKSVVQFQSPTEIEICMNWLHAATANPDQFDVGAWSATCGALIPRLVDIAKGAKANDE